MRIDHILLVVSTSLVAALAAPAWAQTAQPATPEEIQVEGRMTDYAKCQVMAGDTFYRARAATGMERGSSWPAALPTRTPRTPDYSKPPLVPAGSPLPNIVLVGDLTRGPRVAKWGDASTDSHEGMIGMLNARRSPTFMDTKMPTPRNGSRDITLGEGKTAEQVQQECAEKFVLGPNSLPEMPRPTMQNPNDEIRVFAVDKNLPMALALFDQGRFAESLPWFVRAAHSGYGLNEANLFIGKLYLEGLGAKSNAAEAVRYLKQVAGNRYDPNVDTPEFDPARPERNTAIGEAAVMLGNIYSIGARGVDKDPAEARRWYQRAYVVGHIPAAKVVGDIHLHGFGVPVDAREAVEWYTKAANFGLPAAQVALANLIDVGAPGVKKDRRQALKWYQSAATLEHPDALLALARAYDFGDGVKADPEMALGLYKTAALNGSTPAKTALGIYFHEGKLVEQSEATARLWFERAAAERDAEAMFNLAAMMANGEGGGRDLTSAWMWLKEASAGGHAKAPVALAALERRMSPAERAATAQKAP